MTQSQRVLYEIATDPLKAERFFIILGAVLGFVVGLAVGRL